MPSLPLLLLLRWLLLLLLLLLILLLLLLRLRLLLRLLLLLLLRLPLLLLGQLLLLLLALHVRWLRVRRRPGERGLPHACVCCCEVALDAVALRQGRRELLLLGTTCQWQA